MGPAGLRVDGARALWLDSGGMEPKGYTIAGNLTFLAMASIVASALLGAGDQSSSSNALAAALGGALPLFGFSVIPAFRRDRWGRIAPLLVLAGLTAAEAVYRSSR